MENYESKIYAAYNMDTGHPQFMGYQKAWNTPEGWHTEELSDQEYAEADAIGRLAHHGIYYHDGKPQMPLCYIPLCKTIPQELCKSIPPEETTANYKAVPETANTYSQNLQRTVPNQNKFNNQVTPALQQEEKGGYNTQINSSMNYPTILPNNPMNQQNNYFMQTPQNTYNAPTNVSTNSYYNNQYSIPANQHCNMQNNYSSANTMQINNSQPIYNTDIVNFANTMEANSKNLPPLMNVDIEILCIIEGINPRYQCKITFNKTGETIEKEVPVKIFADGKWLNDIPGFAVINFKKANTLKEYLNTLVFNYNGPKIKEISKPGWTFVNNQYVYVTPQGSIGGNFNLFSRYGQKFVQPYQNAVMGHLPDFLEMQQLTPNKPIASIICLYTVLSFTHTLFKDAGYPAKFILFIDGFRGIMKTSLALAMTQLENKKTPTYTLKATGAGLEAGFRDYKDAVMLIDDLAPTNDTAMERELQKNLELVVRCFGDGTGRMRNNDYQDKNIQQYEAEGGAIITGEYTTGVESSRSRCLFLELHEYDIDEVLLSKFQEDNHEKLVRFLLGLITYITHDQARLKQLIADTCKNYRALYKGRFSNSRYAEYLAQLKTASELLIDFGYNTNQLNMQDIELLRQYHEAAIITVINQNDIDLVEESSIVSLCNAIVSAIENNDYPIMHISSNADKKADIIFFDEQNYYIPQVLLKKIKDSYDRKNGYENASNMWNSKRMSKLLAEKGIIPPSSEGDDTHRAQKLPNKGNRRYLIINKMKLQKYVRL